MCRVRIADRDNEVSKRTILQNMVSTHDQIVQISTFEVEWTSYSKSSGASLIIPHLAAYKEFYLGALRTRKAAVRTASLFAKWGRNHLRVGVA